MMVSLVDFRPAEPRRLPVAMSLADARLKRRIDAARRGRDMTTQEREVLERVVEGIPMPDGPIAMLPVAQLYMRDVPGLRPHAGADLVQVLWCPFDHDSDSGAAGMPRTALFWRSADAVTDILVDPPEPAVPDDRLHRVGCRPPLDPVRGSGRQHDRWGTHQGASRRWLL
jgi:hypothetical protein